MPQKRIFIAIHYHPTPDFLSWFRDLKRMTGHESVKWTDEHNFHVTLKFIGDTPDPLIPPLIVELQRIAPNFSPFELTPKGLGYFGPAHSPRVFWTALDDPSQTLASLAQAVDEVCQKQLKTERESQPFTAHLTLGRPKKLSPHFQAKDWVKKFENVTFQSIKVNDFLLIWSTLTPAGPIYKTLRNFPLGRI
jgi:2'-5' RNA ligase